MAFWLAGGAATLKPLLAAARPVRHQTAPVVLQAVPVKIVTEILFWQCAIGRKPSTAS